MIRITLLKEGLDTTRGRDEMAIERSDAPTGALEAVQRVLGSRAATSTFFGSRLSAANPRALSLSMPHRVAYLALERIHRTASLREVTRLGSWRFLVHEKQRRVITENGVTTEKDEYVPIAAAIADRTKAGTYQLGEVNEGPFVIGTEEAVGRAEVFEEVRRGRFEVLLLMVPAVYVAALWLQDRNGDSDIVLTIPPSNPALVPYQPMRSTDFLTGLRELAKKLRR
jgi:hypothetical protein